MCFGQSNYLSSYFQCIKWIFIKGVVCKVERRFSISFFHLLANKIIHFYCRDSLLLFRFNPTEDRKSTRLNSSHVRISYAVFCLKKKKTKFTLHPPISLH